MTPDLKRLCEAAEDAYNDQSGSPFSLDCREAIVRAVLIALRDMEWCATEGADRVSRVGDGGWTERADPEQEFVAAIDHILAEPAKA